VEGENEGEDERKARCKEQGGRTKHEGGRRGCRVVSNNNSLVCRYSRRSRKKSLFYILHSALCQSFGQLAIQPASHVG